MALGLTLDSETLTMLAGDDPRAVAIVKAARSVGALVHVPAVVLAEAATGDAGRDARVSRTVKSQRALVVTGTGERQRDQRLR